MIPKLNIQLLNYYMLLGWILVFGGLTGTLFFLMAPTEGLETVFGFAVASIPCGLLLIYLGANKKTLLKKQKK